MKLTKTTLILLLNLLILSITGAVTYQGPITITKPGTYSGNYRSNDPSVPAISVKCSSGTVVIEDCNLAGVGTLIYQYSPAPDNLTIRHNKGVGEFSSSAGVLKPRFLMARKPESLYVQNNDIIDTLGMRIYELSDDYSTSDVINISKNTCLNIDGRYSNGDGGGSTSSLYSASFIQLHSVRAASNLSISWNEIVNDPFDSHVGDIISVYLSSGRNGNPIKISNNYIEGGYHADALNAAAFSGVGINTGDGNPGNDSGLLPNWVQCYGNHVLNTGHAGISISSGKNMTVNNNRVWSSSKVNGQYYYYSWAGVYVVNHHNLPSSQFTNHKVYNNASTWAWARTVMNPVWRRGDYRLLDNTSAWNNYSIEPRGQEPNLSQLDVEAGLWLSKLSTYNVSVGPNW